MRRTVPTTNSIARRKLEVVRYAYVIIAESMESLAVLLMSAEELNQDKSNLKQRESRFAPRHGSGRSSVSLPPPRRTPPKDRSGKDLRTDEDDFKTRPCSIGNQTSRRLLTTPEERPGDRMEHEVDLSPEALREVDPRVEIDYEEVSLAFSRPTKCNYWQQALRA